MELALQIIIPSVTALLAVHWVYFKVLKIAKNKNLVDNPEARKLQKEPVPVLGGIAVFWGMAAGMFVGAAAASALVWVRIGTVIPIVFSMALMLYVGALDDILGLSPRSRLFIEIVALLCLIYTSGISANSLHGLWGVETIRWWFAVPLSVFAGVGIINAVNMIDGVNGLSSGMCIVCCLLFGAIFIMAGDIPNVVLAFVMVAALIPFFMHNVFGNTSRMFIGDAGTMMMGILLTWFTLCILNRNTTAVFWINGNEVNMIAIALAILSIPVFDTLRVMIWRIRHGKNPFHADKTHLHHVFIYMGVSHSMTALIEIVIDLLMVGIAVLAVYLGANKDWQLYIVVIAGTVFIGGTYFLLRLLLYRYPKIRERLVRLSHSTNHTNKRWWLRLQHWLDRREEQIK